MVLLVRCLFCCAGGLPWRPDKDGGDALHVDKQWVLHKKAECVQQPHLLCRTVQMPGG